MSSLLKNLQQLAETGDPYFQRAMKEAAKVKIRSLRRNSLLTTTMKSGIFNLKPESGKCYDNALKLGLVLESQGTMYVEGFVMIGDLIYSHAWISDDGNYYDPTYEEISKRHRETPSLIKVAEYVKIAEMKASYAWANCLPGGRSTEYLPPVPVTVSMWGFDDSKRDFYAPDGIQVESLEEILKIIAVPS